MPGISTERIKAGIAQASAVGTVGRGAIRDYGGDAASTKAVKDKLRGIEPPPKASAAPGGTQQYTYTGLCAALNQFEQDRVKAGTVEIANVYEVQFAPDSLKAETVTLPGSTDQNATSMQSNNTAKSRVPDTNKMNNKSRNYPATAGTLIVQFIDQVIRSSSYITKQQTVIQDQLTSKETPSNSSSANNTTTWFKISTKAVPISNKIDKKRHGYAYRITYTVSTYQINQAESQYFPQAQFQGAHKVYDYWFTGLNSQVISFEQKYDKAYYNAIYGAPVIQIPGLQDLAAQVQYGLGPVVNSPSIASSQSDKGAVGAALNPASTLADYLYSAQDQNVATITIVGDPAWITQGEILGLDATNFEFKGFYSDGTINADRGQAVFVINWNAPSDYNQGTSGPYSGDGLMNMSSAGMTGTNPTSTVAPSAGTAPQAAQASAAYVALEVTSTFSKGKFEQKVIGNLLKNLNAKEIATNSRANSTAANKTKQNETSQPKADVRLTNQQKAGAQIAAVKNFFANPLKNIGG
jgi:hypothetical protein